MNASLHSHPPMRAIALCLLALTIAASAANPAPPAGAPELEKLRASYKAAAAKGATPVLQSHIATLEKLRDIYARGANVAGATKVQADIDRAKVAMSTGEFLPPSADANAAAAELDKLRTGHEADIERALKPYKETYVRELGKLRDNYTRAANLAAANAVQEELTAMLPDKTPKATAAKIPPPAKEVRATYTPPKPEWYIGKTWVSDSGVSWTFKRDGKGEVNSPGAKKTQMTWEVTRGGLLKLRNESSTPTDVVPLFMYFTSPTEGQCGVRMEAMDQILHPKK